MTPWILLACGQTDPAPSPLPEEAAPVSSIETLDPVAWATRASLDLRGVRPSVAELEQVAADPDALPTLMEAWIAEPAFAERMAWRYNDHLHTALFFETSPDRAFQVSEASMHALGWEPLALVQLTLEADRPFSDVVTSPWLPRHPDQAAALGWEGPEAGWEPYGAPDDRPMAGLLSSTSLWFRYDGDRINHNRRRGNALAALFACADFLDREGGFEFDLSAEELQDMEAAVQTQPACQTCHAALDPLSASMGGFAERSVPDGLEELARYSELEQDWYRGWTTPSWYGQPVGDLADLGAHIAADPRFARCTAQVFSQALLGRELSAADPLADWTRSLTDAELRVSALALEVVLSDEYGADEPRTLRPDQLDAVLVGLGLSEETAAELSWDPELRVLAGGSDDATVLVPNPSPSLGHHLVLGWAGRQLAAERPLPDETAEVRQAAAELHWTFLSRAPTDTELDALVALHDAAGWEGVVEGLVRHPAFLLY